MSHSLHLPDLRHLAAALCLGASSSLLTLSAWAVDNGQSKPPHLLWNLTRATILEKCGALPTAMTPHYTKAVQAIAAKDKLGQLEVKQAVDTHQKMLEATMSTVTTAVSSIQFDFSNPDTANNAEVLAVLQSLGDMAAYCTSMTQEAPMVFAKVAALTQNPKSYAPFAAPDELGLKVQKMVDAVVTASPPGAFPVHRKQQAMVN